MQEYRYLINITITHRNGDWVSTDIHCNNKDNLSSRVQCHQINNAIPSYSYKILNITAKNQNNMYLPLLLATD